MAINRLARPVSLAWSDTSGDATSPLNSLQSWSFQDNQEVAEFLRGNARVDGHYRGKTTATITVETDDMGAFVDFAPGDSFEDLVLTVENAIEVDGTACGGSATITLEHAKLTERGEITHDNADSSPVVGTLTFTLSRSCAATSDPTITIAAVV